MVTGVFRLVMETETRLKDPHSGSKKERLEINYQCRNDKADHWFSCVEQVSELITH